jgi:hypothetical protein
MLPRFQSVISISPPSLLKFLLVENPAGDLGSVEDELPCSTNPEVGQAPPKTLVTNGPDGATKEFGHLLDREGFTQRVVLGRHLTSRALSHFRI